MIRARIDTRLGFGAPSMTKAALSVDATVGMAGWQREEEEAAEPLLTDLPVHPKDGSVGPAEEHQRRTCLQSMTKEQLLEVDALVRDRWQLQRPTSPAWLQGILLSQALA